jgi:hypothetical protein
MIRGTAQVKRLLNNLGKTFFRGALHTGLKPRVYRRIGYRGTTLGPFEAQGKLKRRPPEEKMRTAETQEPV